MDRRRFVTACGGALLGAPAVPALARAAGGPRLRRIGLELYSVRGPMARDPEGTLAAVRAMGYEYVELLWSFGNFGRTPAQVAQALRDTGLRAPSAHMSVATLQVGWERSLEVAHTLGHELLIVPGFTPETQRSLDDWKGWADVFNRAGAVARRAGLWLALHNEPDHQRPLDGQVPFEVFAAATDPSLVRLQLDVGNMVMGGGDPLDFLRRFGDRCWSFHVKDVVADRSGDTELGRGIVDLARILAAAPHLEDAVCYVEQEGARDPLASARHDLDYLRGLAP